MKPLKPRRAGAFRQLNGARHCQGFWPRQGKGGAREIHSPHHRCPAFRWTTMLNAASCRFLRGSRVGLSWDRLFPCAAAPEPAPPGPLSGIGSQRGPGLTALAKSANALGMWASATAPRTAAAGARRALAQIPDAQGADETCARALSQRAHRRAQGGGAVPNVESLSQQMEQLDRPSALLFTAQPPGPALTVGVGISDVTSPHTCEGVFSWSTTRTSAS